MTKPHRDQSACKILLLLLLKGNQVLDTVSLAQGIIQRLHLIECSRLVVRRVVQSLRGSSVLLAEASHPSAEFCHCSSK